VRYFIRWQDNLAEDVTLELFRTGAYVSTIVSNTPSTGAYLWEVDLELLPAPDYAIRVRSTTNSALSDLSDQSFSIVDAPVIDVGSMSQLPDGRIQICLKAPGALQSTVLGSTNLLDWEILQSVPLANGSAVFTDDTSTNFPARYYRMRVP
jgi:hypothetical protein